MNQNKHAHHADPHHHGHKPPKKGIHKDWRVWVAVVLMLAAMAAYVMSFDESLRPGGSEEPSVPAAP